VSKDIGKVEREGLAETRRLKVTLTAAEQELSELRPVIPVLQVLTHSPNHLLTHSPTEGIK